MSTSYDFLRYVLRQVKLPDLTYRKMMGEYILYSNDKMIACLCDDRLLVKPLPIVCSLLPHAKRESPYSGAKEMVLIEDVDNSPFLTAFFQAILPYCPSRKK